MAKKNKFKMTPYGIIMAGGSGTRLWPISREFYPKQVLKLFGNKTLIQQTFRRLEKIMPPENIYVTTSRALKDDIYFQLKGLGMRRENILIEPAIKSTAPTIGFAAQKIFNKDKNACLVVCPSDHLISPDSKFAKMIAESLIPAQKNFLVTLGIIPTNPSSEYGYIKPNLQLATSNLQLNGYPVERFIEKPDKETAEKYIKEGYLWNAGIFIFKARVLLESIKKYLPDIFNTLKIGSRDKFSDKFEKYYSGLSSISIDHGVMECARNVWVVPAKFNWQDIGSWKALYEILPKDAENNVLAEKVLQIGCKNSLIYGAPCKRVVVAIGLDDLVVVDTEDAVLVAQKDKTQEIKKILEEIKNQKLPQYREHPTVHRPWGSYTVLEEGDGFKVKKITVLPKRKLSLQMHHKRSEHWVVLSGTAKVYLNDEVINIGPHKSIGIPVGARHSLENSEKEPLYVVEIQNGSYLGEDDIIRFEDKYGRNENVQST